MKGNLLLISVLFFILPGYAQTDTSFFFSRAKQDSVGLKLNMDAIYNRPFLQMGGMPVSIGGYLESNSSYFRTDGIGNGLSFQIPRLTIFLSANISQRIKFLTEIEFEEGGKEIGIEFAALEMEFHPLFNLRGGIIMNPIGAFNQNHDGPKWEFVDRPLSATTIVPSTFSNVGFGLFGKLAKQNWAYAYEAYLTNGFNEEIIDNSQNRTWFPAVKEAPQRFTKSFNGIPLTTIKLAVKHRKVAELGISWMNGIYNKFEDNGIRLDRKRPINFLAIDLNTNLRSGTAINTEWVWASVDKPLGTSQQFGKKQKGGFLDVVQVVYRGDAFGWKQSLVNLSFRGEYVDYNVGKFAENNFNIGDHTYLAALALSFRPVQQTVIRINYRYEWRTDLLGNPPSRTAGIQIGFSTYF